MLKDYVLLLITMMMSHFLYDLLKCYCREK